MRPAPPPQEHSTCLGVPEEHVFDNIFGIHEQALMVHGQRIGVLAANLANADTPGYKARDIDFSRGAVANHSDTALPLAGHACGVHITFNDGGSSPGELEVPQSLSSIARRQHRRNAGGTGGLLGEQRALSGESQFHQHSAYPSCSSPLPASSRSPQERNRMSLFNVFNVAGSAMNAETIRLNTTASNLANAESVNGDATKVYRARHPVFQAMMNSPIQASTARTPRAGCGCSAWWRAPRRR
jgi:flagellar basal body rod protein FlgC